MASISTSDACARVRELVLAGEQPSDALLSEALDQDEGRSFFAEVVEPLADCFDPGACDSYRELFTRALSLLHIEPSPAIPDAALRRFDKIRRVYVLSRVTLGADIAVTSVILDAAKRRFPDAEITFAGPGKNFDLFRGRAWLQHLELNYSRRGTLSERLAARPAMEVDEHTVVIDPDSRFTQLGMLPACRPEQFIFFESRSWLTQSEACLTELASSWTEAVLGVRGQSFICPATTSDLSFDVAVSFGTGGNDRKRIDDAFERDLLRTIADRGLRILLDGGAGGGESQRAQSLAADIRAGELYSGPFAPFASAIANARLYVGYDSAGGHVAAAAGTPAVSIFNGYASQRFLQRWRPCGSKTVVIVADARGLDPLEAARAAVTDLL